VRYAFSEYAKGQIGMHQITRALENMGALTKSGKKLWLRTLIKCMLRNETYTGVRYFNTTRLVREKGNPFESNEGKHRSRKWLVPRDRADWIGIKIPAIIPKSLFDEVQKRIEWNRKRYRNPRQTQLLSCLVRCGSCGGSFFAYRTTTRDKRVTDLRILHRAAYKCNWRYRQQAHSKDTVIDRCHNKEINTEALEARVFGMIRDVMLDPAELRRHVDLCRTDDICIAT
jgi:Recombinase/Recombinase zinc beta ribbon domain